MLDVVNVKDLPRSIELFVVSEQVTTDQIACETSTISSVYEMNS